MNKLDSIKTSYEQGRMKKPTYIRRMHTIHSVLFDYAKFIRGTDIKEIQITDNSVIMTSRLSGARFLCTEKDERIAPIESLNFAGYEMDEFSVLRQLLQRNAVVFDIGANIGWYSVTIGTLLPSSRIYSFEPIPVTYATLLKNITLNQMTNVRTYNIGFSNTKKKMTLYYYPEGSGNASLANLTDRLHIQKISCAVTTLDEFIRKMHCRVDVIKCDVEGAELLVFQGAQNTIQRYKPIILSEILRKWTKQFRYNPNDILALLFGLGYTCFTVHNGRLREFKYMDKNTKETNFVFLHSVKHVSKIKKLREK